MVDATASSFCYKQSAIIPFCRAARPIHTCTKKSLQKKVHLALHYLFFCL